MDLELIKKKINECSKSKDTDLDLSDLDLHIIPKEIGDLTHLLSLNLSNNKIRDIQGLENLVNLEKLDLSRNNILQITGLKNLTKLKILRFWSNHIYKIEGLDTLSQLKILDLTNNDIREITGIDKLSCLADLDLADNNISRITGLDKCLDIKNINLSFNLITEISGLDNCGGILYLDIAYNQIETISNLENLKSLIQLDLSYNNISTIQGLTTLVELEDLNLSKNLIKRIENLDSLLKLVFLDLSENQISEISGISHLINLTSLSLAKNNIYRIEGLNEKQEFEFLSLSSNPLEEEYGLVLNNNEDHWGIVKNIINRGFEQIQINLALPAKILLLGNHSSGKSSLLNYIQKNSLKFKGDSTHLLSIEYYPQDKPIPDAIFYDFGGQDYYHGIYRTFFSIGSIYLLLWNSGTDRNEVIIDFNGISTLNFNVSYWVEQKRHLEIEKLSNVEQDPLLLVQTHAESGIRPFGYYPETSIDSSILNSFYISLSTKYNPPKNQYSLKYLKSTIDELIQQRKIQRQEPKWYVDFFKFILNSRDIEPFALSDLLKKYRPSNIKKNSEKLQSLIAELQQFHNQGLVLYDSEIDKNIVWTNPQGLVEFIHEKILQKEKLSRYKGMVPIDTFKDVDSNIINLLKKQKVIFQHDYGILGQEYIIPNYLPLIKDNDVEYQLFTFGLNEPLFVLKFLKYLPVGLINQLICWFGKQPDQKKFWRDQLLFTFEKKCKVLIHLDFQKLEIRVIISFLNQSDAEKEAISRYLFYSLMSVYWDFEPMIFSDYLKLDKETGKEQKFQNEFDDPLSSHRSRYKKMYESEKCKPRDMYVSRNGIDYVKYEELSYQNNETRVLSNQFVNDELNVDSKLIPIKPFEIFTNKKMNSVKKVMISYSKDDLPLVHRFMDALTLLHEDGLIENPWYCTKLEAGSNWNHEIQSRIQEVDIVFFMCSISFIRTKYIREHEIRTVFELSKQKPITIIPIVLNFCEWDNYFSDYSTLPFTARPVMNFENMDMAWYIIIKEIRMMLEGKADDDRSKLMREIYERVVKGEV
jgi:internalin A